MEKYSQIYGDNLSKITYAAANGIPLSRADVKMTTRNKKMYLAIKMEIEAIRNSGQGIILPN